MLELFSTAARSSVISEATGMAARACCEVLASSSLSATSTCSEAAHTRPRQDVRWCACANMETRVRRLLLLLHRATQERKAWARRLQCRAYTQAAHARNARVLKQYLLSLPA